MDIAAQITGPATPSAPLTRRPTRTARLRRGLGLATAVLVGAGAIGLGSSVGTAVAEPAPSQSGWDGSRYWFTNDAGEWRWTSHYAVYQDRTGTDDNTGDNTGDGDSANDTATGSTGGDGIEQGWDGSVYWFRNSSGAWRYTSHRDIYLSRTGSRGAAAAESSAEAPAAAPSRGSDHEAAVEFALAQLGKPFVMGGNGPDGYDCSGLIQQAYRHAGVSLPRIAADQYAATTPVDADQLQRGDLLFWSSSGSSRGIYHAAVYLGNQQFVVAPHPGASVRIGTLNSGWFPTHIGRP